MGPSKFRYQLNNMIDRWIRPSSLVKCVAVDLLLYQSKDLFKDLVRCRFSLQTVDPLSYVPVWSLLSRVQNSAKLEQVQYYSVQRFCDVLFIRHVERGTCLEALRCQECSKMCKSQEKLSSHNCQKPSICTVCKKTFKNTKSLKDHLVSHDEERNFKCNICGKCFKRKADLNVHMKTHTGEKPFACCVCDAKFATSSHLNSHLNVHIDVRPFSCDVCQMTFKTKSTLLKHKQLHDTTDKCHKCNICEMSFRTVELLKSHEKTHTARKAYTCEDCGKAFSLLNYLKTHIQRVHAAANLPCPLCPKVFTQSSTLKKHLKSHKNTQKEERVPLFKCEECLKTFKSRLNLIKHKAVHKTSSNQAVWRRSERLFQCFDSIPEWIVCDYFLCSRLGFSNIPQY